LIGGSHAAQIDVTRSLHFAVWKDMIADGVVRSTPVLGDLFLRLALLYETEWKGDLISGHPGWRDPRFQRKTSLPSVENLGGIFFARDGSGWSGVGQNDVMG
jgi:hypothetical protein